MSDELTVVHSVSLLDLPLEVVWDFYDRDDGGAHEEASDLFAGLEVFADELGGDDGAGLSELLDGGVEFDLDVADGSRADVGLHEGAPLPLALEDDALVDLVDAADAVEVGVLHGEEQAGDVHQLEDRAVGHRVEAVVVFRRQVEHRRVQLRVLLEPQQPQLLRRQRAVELARQEVAHAVVDALHQDRAVLLDLLQRQHQRVRRRNQRELRLRHWPWDDLPAEKLVPRREVLQRVHHFREVHPEYRPEQADDDSPNSRRHPDV